MPNSKEMKTMNNIYDSNSELILDTKELIESFKVLVTKLTLGETKELTESILKDTRLKLNRDTDNVCMNLRRELEELYLPRIRFIKFLKSKESPPNRWGFFLSEPKFHLCGARGYHNSVVGRGCMCVFIYKINILSYFLLVHL